MQTRIYLDIETIPVGDPVDPQTLTPPGNMKKADTIQAWRMCEAPRLAEEQFRKRSLDSMAGEILCVAWAINDQDIHGIHVELDEKDLMVQLEKQLSSTIPVDGRVAWVGHNALDFDMTWLWRRAIKFKLPWLSYNINIDRYKGNIHDTMQIWGGRNNYCKLDDIARFLGIPGKTEGIDGSQVYDFYLEGKVKEIMEYCKNDVQVVRDIYHQIMWDRSL